MNGSHSGNGTVKSENRKKSYKEYRDKNVRLKNKIRKIKRHIKKHINDSVAKLFLSKNS